MTPLLHDFTTHIVNLAIQAKVPIDWTTDGWAACRISDASFARLMGQYPNLNKMDMALHNHLLPTDTHDVVYLPLLTTEWNYALALHEMGHIFAPTSSECEAWQMAHTLAPVWTPEMSRAATHCINTYYFIPAEQRQMVANLPLKGL